MQSQERFIKITYLGGAWPTNMGNSFIDLGSMQSLKMASPNASIFFASEMPQWFFYFSKKNPKKAINIASLINSDYLAVSGMMMCDEFIKLYEPVIASAIKKGIKFIINGGGGEKYTSEEVQHFRSFLKRNPPYAFISRDEVSFNAYKDLAEHSFNGIDCGFFVSDYLNYTKLDLPDFIILNFDRSPIRQIFNKIKINYSDLQNLSIINIHHSCWPSTSIVRNTINLFLSDKYIYQQNTLISDIPEDYLQLYANTKATFSDRVHACIATFAFGHPAMLFSKTKRAFLFKRLGLETVQEKLTYPDMMKIKEEKIKQVQFLASILNKK